MNIYLLDVKSITEHEITEYAQMLDGDRRKGIAQCQRSADRRRSFGAGMALLYAWKKQFGERTMPKVMRDENGKPRFTGADIPFCLSHSGNYAACVLGEETGGAPFGLDIQEPRAVRAGLAERFFSDREKEQLRTGDDFCLIWSRKESLAKYQGSGLRGDLRALDTTGESIGLLPDQKYGKADDAPIRYLVRTAEGACLWSCMTADGYAVSVCTDRPLPFVLVFLDWERIKEELICREMERNQTWEQLQFYRKQPKTRSR